jgi:agmatinase
MRVTKRFVSVMSTSPASARDASSSAADRPPEDGVFGLGDSVETAATVIVPVPWEATTSYGRGTAAGPAAVLAASVQVDLFDLELGEPWRAGVAMLDVDPELARRSLQASRLANEVIEAFRHGDPLPPGHAALERVNAESAWLDQHLLGAVGYWLDRGKRVGVLGGDHSVAFASIAAHAERHPAMGVLQFDAHADLRVAYQGFVGSHASVMHRVIDELPGVATLVSVGVRDLSADEHRAAQASNGRIVPFYDEVIAGRLAEGEPFGAIARDIAEALPASVYVSFDIDGLDPALCPHTGTPVPGGLSFQQAQAVLRALVKSGRRIVGFDLCEVGPEEWDANVGARLLYKLIGFSLLSRGG